jgi:hypothetical protein
MHGHHAPCDDQLLPCAVVAAALPLPRIVRDSSTAWRGSPSSLPSRTHVLLLRTASLDFQRGKDDQLFLPAWHGKLFFPLSECATEGRESPPDSLTWPKPTCMVEFCNVVTPSPPIPHHDHLFWNGEGRGSINIWAVLAWHEEKSWAQNGRREAQDQDRPRPQSPHARRLPNPATDGGTRVRRSAGR